MSQESYLQIKKEYRVRKFLVIFLFIIFVILDILLALSRSRYVPLLTTAMATLVPFNHFFLVPFWRQKKAIEEEHSEWKELSTKGVKVPSAEANKRTLAGIGTLIALLLSFGLTYKPAKQPNVKVNQVDKQPKIDFKAPETSSSSESESSSSSEMKDSSSSEMKDSSSSESKASASTEQGSKTESSETRPSKSESNNSYYQIPGLTDEQVRDIVSKSVKDMKEQESKEKSEE